MIKSRIVRSNQHFMNIHNKGIICICILSLFYLSCKRCETRNEPEFTEDELSWVNIDNLNPPYQIKYKEGSVWKTDTVMASHVYSGITYSSFTEGDCEDNVRFPTANIRYCISFPNKPKCYGPLVIIRNDRIFSVQITDIHKVLNTDPRTDTAKILDMNFEQVYKSHFGNSSKLFLSKKYGLIYLLLDNGLEANIIL